MTRELGAGVMAIFLLLPACSRKPAAGKVDPQLQAYAVAQDTTDPQHLIPLDHQQAQGARVFQTNCVWCHADAPPPGLPTAPT
jgi:mono/diheme cytochrome c family protein